MAQITLNSSGVASSGSLLLQTNGTTTQATFDTSGNMGLGVTPSAWGSSRTVLQLGNTNSYFVGKENTVLGNNAFNNGTNWIYQTTGANAHLYSQLSGGSHAWYNAPSGTAGNAITFTQAMTLDASGNLLVGTTSASGKVTSVTSGVTAGSFTGASSAAPGTSGFWNNYVAGLDLYDSAGSSGYGVGIRFRPNNGGTYPVAGIASLAPSTTTSALVFHTQDANGSVPERARIDSSGSFFVGATSLSGNAVQIYNNSNQAGRININKTTSGLFNALVNTYSGTTVGGIDYSNTGTAFNTSSDVRLKKDIVDAGSASAKIEQIRIVSHGWKHDDEIVEFGVVAQELVNVAPQAVSAGDNGEEIERTWGVDYSKLVPMLIKAHQEQQTIITALTARIEALEQA